MTRNNLHDKEVPAMEAGDLSQLLRNGGEMGRLMREFPWERTPLGPVQTWSQRLLGAVNILLSCQFPMFIWWGQRLIQLYNDPARPSLGTDGQRHPTALGQPGENCFPDSWPVIYPLMRQVMEEGVSIWKEDEPIPLHRDGEWTVTYWTFSLSPIMDDDGNIGGVLGVCSDTTDKIVSYRRVKESEDQLSFAIEATELGTWDYSPATAEFSGNTRLKAWFGLGPSDQLALSAALETIAPEDRQRVQEAIEDALTPASGGYYDEIYSIVDAAGAHRVVHAKGRAWFGEDKVAYRFNGTMEDITARERARKELEASRERTRMAIESAELGTYEVNLLTDEVVTSDRFDAIWGITGKVDRHALVDRIHPEDRALRLAAHRMALETGSIDYEARLIWPDGSLHWVKVKGTITHDGLGAAQSLTGVVQDITLFKMSEDRLTREVADRTVALQQSNDDLQQFAHVISHDLKEPVRKIRMFIDRITHEVAGKLPERSRSYMQKIDRSAARMAEMIDGVLEYASLQDAEHLFENVDLNRVVDHIRTDLEVALEQHSGKILSEFLPVVRGIPVQIYQLLYNLINNSVKFAQPGIPPEIRISAEGLGGLKGFVEIRVSDNGIGFNPKYADHIFNPFKRLHSKDKYEGTGLGLSLSRKIVERHGGVIGATGEPGKGAVFLFTLPLAQ